MGNQEACEKEGGDLCNEEGVGRVEQTDRKRKEKVRDSKNREEGAGKMERHRGKRDEPGRKAPAAEGGM